MKATRYTEEKIIGVLKEAEAGAKTMELCRRHGVWEATFYNWKAKKFAGMTVSEARRLKEREAENTKLMPTAESAKLLKDELLFQRATQTFLWALPLTNTLGPCFSDEPGIYIPGEFGMHNEDCWYVTDRGSKLFTVLAESIDNSI